MTHLQPPHIQRALATRESKRAYFDKISGVYDLLSDRAEEPVRVRGLELLDAQAGEKILELGCGTGHATISLAGSVGEAGRVDALDLSPKMIRQAEANVHALELHDRVNFIVGDALKLNAADATYDAVFASFTIELFDSDEMSSILAEVRRVLRPGGRFAVVSVSCEGDDSAAVKVNEWAHRHLPNLLDCRPIYVRRLLESHGFTIAVAETQSMWIPVEIVVATTS
jgi:ubiquinone/menaquinone biosynthesis C-methylase UbiE